MKTRTAIYVIAIILTCPWLHSESSELEKRHTEHILPTLSIADAIKISEDYLQNKQRDISKHFISSVVYHEFEFSKSAKGEGPCWLVTYTLKEHASGGQYFVLVYMDRKVWLRHGI